MVDPFVVDRPSESRIKEKTRIILDYKRLLENSHPNSPSKDYLGIVCFEALEIEESTKLFTIG